MKQDARCRIKPLSSIHGYLFFPVSVWIVHPKLFYHYLMFSDIGINNPKKGFEIYRVTSVFGRARSILLR